MNNTAVRLLALVEGNKKSGGKWYKVLLRKTNDNGNVVTAEFFLPEIAGENAIRAGLKQDVDVICEFAFDDYMRIGIADIKKAPTVSSKVASSATLGV